MNPGIARPGGPAAGTRGRNARWTALAVSLAVLVAPPCGAQDAFKEYINRAGAHLGSVLFLGMFESEETKRDLLAEHPEIGINPFTGRPYDRILTFAPDHEGAWRAVWEVVRVVGDNLQFSPLTPYSEAEDLVIDDLVTHSNAGDVAANLIKARMIRVRRLYALSAPAGFESEARDLPVEEVLIAGTKGDMILESLSKVVLTGLLMQLGDTDVGIVPEASDERTGAPVLGLRVRRSFGGPRTRVRVESWPAYFADDPEFQSPQGKFEPHYLAGVVNSAVLRRMCELENALANAGRGAAGDEPRAELEAKLRTTRSQFPLAAKHFDAMRHVPDYWTSDDPDEPASKRLAEASTLCEMLRQPHCVVVVGEGAAADLMYSRLVQALGKEAVLRLPSASNPATLQLEARRFGADAIVGSRESPGNASRARVQAPRRGPGRRRDEAAPVAGIPPPPPCPPFCPCPPNCGGDGGGGGPPCPPYCGGGDGGAAPSSAAPKRSPGRGGPAIGGVEIGPTPVGTHRDLRQLKSRILRLPRTDSTGVPPGRP